MKKETATARQFCANYSGGKCAGVMMKRDDVLKFWIDSKCAGKDCNPSECLYFSNIVIPGIPKEYLWMRR